MRSWRRFRPVISEIGELLQAMQAMQAKMTIDKGKALCGKGGTRVLEGQRDQIKSLVSQTLSEGGT